jgi:hypothetical protein
MLVALHLSDLEYSLWATDAVTSGLTLADWIRRRVGAVEPVRRTPSEVVALLARKHAVPEVRSDDDDGDGPDEIADEEKAPEPLRVKSTRGRIKDIAGQVFGKLTAVEMAGRSRGGSVMWRCVCECGAEKVVASSDLVSGMTKSCGCGRRGPRPRPSV